MRIAEMTYAFTRTFPTDQRFVLTAQMQRAAVSIGSNIYEACGRPAGKPFIAFLYYALGSTSELQFQLRLAIHLGYGNTSAATELSHEIVRMKQGLSLLIKRQPR